MNNIRVELPGNLRTLAGIAGCEVTIEVADPVTQATVVDALEARFPMFRGTIRDQNTRERRAFLRFFACGEDLSFEGKDVLLPESVRSGKEPFLIVGAVSGG